MSARTRAVVDRALWPSMVVLPVLAATLAARVGITPAIVTPLVVGPYAIVVFVLEHVRPERVPAPGEPRRDMPIWQEVGHFLLNFEVGYGLAMLACEALGGPLRTLLGRPTWPSDWPLPAQLLGAVVLYEATSYWQHRAFHRWGTAWRFHALHHSGAHLDFARAVRFHAVDIGTASFVAYLPLVVLGAPDAFFAQLGVLLSAIGLLQHANIRMRTPAWLDWLVCTPAVHRHHHSRDHVEGNTNFANTLMIFDHLFGTYGRPVRAEGPVVIGIDGDPVPADFVGQVFGPFRLKS